MKKILLSIALILFAGGALALGSTGAFFSDIELSSGNTFSAGAIDLKIDNTSYYNGVATSTTSWTLADLTIEKFFNFFDLKPGDYGEDTISLHVDTNDAYLCASITLTSDDDNTCNEPELGDEPNCTAPGVGQGELAQNVNFMWWADDGDNVLETGEEVISTGPIGALTLNTPYPITLADSDQNIWTGIGGPVAALDIKYIGKAWCFGSVGQVPVTQDGSGNLMTPAGNNNGNGVSGEPEDGGYSCNGSALNNDTQTDSLTADVSFSAVQSRNNSGFQCDEPREEILACETPTLAYADSVVDSNQGERKNGTAVNADRSDPLDALGAPQSLGAPFDSPVPTGEFFSLGFDEEADATPLEGGWIVVEFTDNVIVDGPGNDLRVWEITGGTSYPVEKVKIEVSQDGSTWFPVASSLDRDAEADLATSGLPWAKYVRLTDVSVESEFEDIADGYDLDAFSALNCGVIGDGGPVEIEDELPPPTGTLTVTKIVVPGNDQTLAVIGDFALLVDGFSVTSGVATTTSAGAHVVSETNNDSDYVSVIGGADCDVSGNVSVPTSGSASCTITNTFVPPLPQALWTDNFGAGSIVDDIANWEEEGNDADSTTVSSNATGGGDNSVSDGDGGRFAKIGAGEWICRSVDASTFNTLAVKYYWRGDSDAEDDSDIATVEYYTGGTCDAPTGLVSLATHELDDGNLGSTSWSTLQTINLPAGLNSTSFSVRFHNSANTAGEDFRVDAVSVTGIPN